MISGLAKSEVKPREDQVFATAMTFASEPIQVTSYSRKAKKNRTKR